jgi:anti-sigma regulatory factor (Ser/Thr protein kinase)
MSLDETAFGTSAELRLQADLMEVSVPAGPAAPAAARDALTRWLSPRVTDGLLVDAPLVVSELVTNSLRHGRRPQAATVRISAQLADGMLRLEVEDPGTVGAVGRRTTGNAHGGFGLNIVDALAVRWGVDRDGGTVVWVELAATQTV